MKMENNYYGCLVSRWRDALYIINSRELKKEILCPAALADFFVLVTRDDLLRQITLFFFNVKSR